MQAELLVPAFDSIHVRIESALTVVEVPGMPGISFTSAGSLAKAAGVKTLLDTGKVRLFKEELVPTSATTKAEFVAAEADFKGYIAPAVTWSAPLLESGGGASIRSGLLMYSYDSTAVGGETSNRIAGCWVEDTNDKVWYYFVLPEVITVEGDGTGVPLLILDTEGAPTV